MTWSWFSTLSGLCLWKAHLKPVSRLPLHPFLAYKHHDLVLIFHAVWSLFEKGTPKAWGQIANTPFFSIPLPCGMQCPTFHLAKVPCLVLIFPDCLASVSSLHCKEDSNYVFPEIKLRSLIPNFHIHTSASDLFSPRIGLPILLQQNRQTDRGTRTI